MLRWAKKRLLLRRRVGDIRSAAAVIGGGEASRGVLAEQREIGFATAGRDGERAAGVGAARGLRPADGRMVGKHDARQIEDVGRRREARDQCARGKA